MNVSSPIYSLTPGARPLASVPSLQLQYRAQMDPSIAPEVLTLSEAVYADSFTSSATTPSSNSSVPTTNSCPDPVQSDSSYLETERLLLKRGQGATTTSSAWNIACDESGFLCGESAALQALGTASRVNATFDTYWQGAPTYRRPGAETLTFQLDDIRAQEHGPFYSSRLGRTIVTNSAATSADPDIIAHEQGHAILDSFCRYNTLNSFTASAHEAFADTTALIAALQSAAVREKVVVAWEKGQLSTVASVLGEGALELRGSNTAIGRQSVVNGQSAVNGESAEGGQSAISSSSSLGGLRDLATPPPREAEADNEEAHLASQRFSHGIYAALHDMYCQERSQSSSSAINCIEVLERVVARVSTDFVNLLHYLPRQPIISQRDLATALLQANREWQGGQGQKCYRNNLGALLAT